MIAADFCGSAGAAMARRGRAGLDALSFDSLLALRQEPSADQHVIRLAADLNAEEVTPDVGAISSTLPVRRVPCSAHPWPSSPTAILLASAIAATFVGRRANNAVSHGRCLVPWSLAWRAAVPFHE